MNRTKLFYEIREWTYRHDLEFVPDDYQTSHEKREAFCFDMLRLRRIERTLHRIGENECNGHPRIKYEYRDGKHYRYSVEDEAWAARDERTEKRALKRMQEISDRWGLGLFHQTDPRGASVKSHDYGVRYQGLEISDFIYRGV